MGQEGEGLLEYQSPLALQDMIAHPGADWVDRIFIPSNRNNRVLSNLERLFSHGRLGNTGYVNILPVDQGIEHTAGFSFAPNPIYFDPENIIKLAIEGGCNGVASTSGVLGAVGKVFTRDGLFDALIKKSCYATTGARIILGFSIAGCEMGGQMETLKKPGLMINRHIQGFVVGIKELKTIEFIRCGKVFHTIRPKDSSHQFTIDDATPLEELLLDKAQGQYPFAYYYLRITQIDGHIAWSSPIWIDETLHTKAT